MKRALAKGSVQFAFGRLPGGSNLYRELTRHLMGTQATHIDKLARVWPGYLRVWRDACGLELEGKRLWIHEGGYTIFPFLIGYLVTGRGPVVTNVEGDLLDQYVERSVEEALRFDPEDSSQLEERRKHLRTLANKPKSALEWVDAIEGTYHGDVKPESLPLVPESVDLAHSGGTLEHYRTPALKTFLHQLGTILKLGGISSHIFDHRDHLYHADKQIPFLNHLRYSERAYRTLFGHPLCFHNRLNSSEVRALFREEGLEEVRVRRLILPDSRYVDSEEEAIQEGILGLDPERLHPRFQHPEADLHTAAAHYLFRKQV